MQVFQTLTYSFRTYVILIKLFIVLDSRGRGGVVVERQFGNSISDTQGRLLFI